MLSPTIHINSSGCLVPASDSKYTWQPIGGPVVQLIGKDSGAASMKLESEVQLDLESSSSLRELIQAIRAVFKHNFIAGMLQQCTHTMLLIVCVLCAGVLSVAAGVYCLHYELIVKEYGACPIPMLVGEAETGNVR